MLVRSILGALTALAISATKASPIVNRQDVIAPNTASCSSYDITGMNGMARRSYEVKVGRPFNEGDGCGKINSDMNDALSPSDGISDYHCDDNTTGGTILTFQVTSGMQGNIAIINGLQKSYPDVPFQKERICLQAGVPVPSYWPPAV